MTTELIQTGVMYGFRYQIRRNPMGVLLAYVEVPEKVLKSGYGHIDDMCHGGITWGYEEGEKEFPDGTPTSDGTKAVGWDYGHAGDYIPEFSFHFPDDTVWTAKDVADEIQEVLSKVRGWDARVTCDPCQHCANLYDDSDESVGLYGYGCRYGDEGGEDWEPGCGHPCPGFRPIPVTESLNQQLYNEYWQKEYEEERRQEDGKNDE